MPEPKSKKYTNADLKAYPNLKVIIERATREGGITPEEIASQGGTYEDIMRGAKGALESANRFTSERDAVAGAMARDRAAAIKPQSRLRSMREDFLREPAVDFAIRALESPIVQIPAAIGTGGISTGLMAAQGIRALVDPSAGMLEKAIGAGVAAVPGIRTAREAYHTARLAPTVRTGSQELVSQTSPMMRRLAQYPSKGKSRATTMFERQEPTPVGELVEDVAETQVMPQTRNVDDLVRELTENVGRIPSKQIKSGKQLSEEIAINWETTDAVPFPRSGKNILRSDESIPGLQAELEAGVPTIYQGEQIMRALRQRAHIRDKVAGQGR